MKSEKWQEVRDLIGTARKRRVENVLAVATKAGALTIEGIEEPHGESRHPHRLRVCFETEIDLLTGETSSHQLAELTTPRRSPSIGKP